MAVADPGGTLQPQDLAAFGPVIPVIVLARLSRPAAALQGRAAP